MASCACSTPCSFSASILLCLQAQVEALNLGRSGDEGKVLVGTERQSNAAVSSGSGPRAAVNLASSPAASPSLASGLTVAHVNSADEARRGATASSALSLSALQQGSTAPHARRETLDGAIIRSTQQRSSSDTVVSEAHGVDATGSAQQRAPTTTADWGRDRASSEGASNRPRASGALASPAATVKSPSRQVEAAAARGLSPKDVKARKVFKAMTKVTMPPGVIRENTATQPARTVQRHFVCKAWLTISERHCCSSNK